MITYEPLRIHLKGIGQTIHYLRIEGLVNSNAAKQLADDIPISLKKVVEICVFLDLEIEDVVKIVRK